MFNPAKWLQSHRAQARLALRMTVAALVAFFLCHLFSLSQTYPAVLTAIIVMQSSVGGSLKAMLDRFVGSLGGAAWGVSVLLVLPHETRLDFGLVLVVVLAPLALVAAVKPAYRVAPVTAMILLLTPVVGAGPLTSAVHRLLEIGLGSIVALAVALVVAPARAHNVLADAAAGAVKLMGELAAILPKGLLDQADPDTLQGLHDRIRKATVQAETAADEAMRERASYLTAGPDPVPICRTLRRLRNDFAMIGRAAAHPLPQPLNDRLAAPTAAAGAAVAAFLAETGEALANHQPAPSLDRVEAGLGQQTLAVNELRKTGLTRDLPDEVVGRLFGLAFGFEQLHHNLEDLADRTTELAQAGKAAPAGAPP